MPHATQFDIKNGLRKRWLEHLMINNHGIGQLVHWIGYSGLSAMIWPRFVAPFRIQLTRFPMLLPRLDPAFNGYKILHLTDLHVGRTNAAYLQRALALGMRERPDLIVITGDFIHYSREGIRQLPAALAPLSAPDGILGIFGNHDYHEYSWRHIGERSAHRAIHKRLVAAVDARGIRLLRNEMVTIRRGAAALQVVGMDELWVGHARPEQAFFNVDQSVACICLQHNPDGIDFLRDHPWDFMLCGHTHGGQVSLPIIGALYVPAVRRDYLQGMFAFADSRGGQKHMFVSRGIGYSTPIRMRVPPEITLFTLERGASE